MTKLESEVTICKPHQACKNTDDEFRVQLPLPAPVPHPQGSPHAAGFGRGAPASGQRLVDDDLRGVQGGAALPGEGGGRNGQVGGQATASGRRQRGRRIGGVGDTPVGQCGFFQTPGQVT